MELFYEASLSTLFLTVSGIYFLFEILLLNIVYFILATSVTIAYGKVLGIFLTSNLLTIVVFNAIDAQQHTDKEYTSFEDRIVIDRQGTRLAEFVDRLLPKHVLLLYARYRGR